VSDEESDSGNGSGDPLDNDNIPESEKIETLPWIDVATLFNTSQSTSGSKDNGRDQQYPNRGRRSSSMPRTTTRFYTVA
jgi:hypothetical protein